VRSPQFGDEGRIRPTTARADQPRHQARWTSRAAMMALIDSGIGSRRWVCWLV
jgi:hypothetical protein